MQVFYHRINSNNCVYCVFIFFFGFACSGTSADEIFKKGNECYNTKNYKLAIGKYDEAIAKNKYFLVAYIRRGMALEFLGEYSKAMDNYEVRFITNNYETPEAIKLKMTFVNLFG